MQQSRRRLMFMAYLMLTVFFLLSCRFFYLQTFKAAHLQKKVVEQRVKEIVEKPERGKIIDKNGEVLAFSLMAKDISLYPNLITTKEHQEKLAKLLSKELKMPYAEVMKKIKAKDKNGNPLQWVALAKRVDVEVAKRIQEANLGGIEIKSSPKRYYPNGKTASSILGFVNDEGEPGAGLELSLNSNLAGVPGYRLAETDSVGKIIPIGFQNISTPIDGQTVQLTIDTYLQSVMENALNKTIKDLQAESVHAVLMNPNTGAILAMASTPGYDPNNYSKAKKRAWTLNPATFVYEPGSIFKPTYMAMAMDLGKIDDNTHFYDGAGSINVNGSWIKNFDGRPLGNMSLEDIITNSSNVGMIHISKTMTTDEIVTNLKRIGYGQKTGVELPGEEMGLFPNASKNKEDFNSLNNDPIRKATVSFGQGISVTPVQITRAFSQLINGGNPINAHIVDKITDNFGNEIYTPAKPSTEKLYKKTTVNNLKKYLNANMIKGSGKTLQIDGVQMGGKSGSAWLVENGRYVDGQIIGSFMGFAPFDNPQVVLLVSVVKPHAEFGATSAGPAWHEIMQETLRYMALNKADEKAKKIEVPEVKWMLVDDAKEKLKSEVKNVEVDVEGNGDVVTDREYRYQNGKINITLIAGKIKAKNGYNIPQLVGKTQDEVKGLLRGTGITVTYHGSGTVEQQKTEPGFHKNIKELILWSN